MENKSKLQMMSEKMSEMTGATMSEIIKTDEDEYAKIADMNLENVVRYFAGDEYVDYLIKVYDIPRNEYEDNEETIAIMDRAYDHLKELAKKYGIHTED